MADKRVGVIWHTQGSGKSLSMIYLTSITAQPAVDIFHVARLEKPDIKRGQNGAAQAPHQR